MVHVTRTGRSHSTTCNIDTSFCIHSTKQNHIYIKRGQIRGRFQFVSEADHSSLNTHTHTHVGFYGLRGLSIGVMVFILYKLYVLLPYTYPTPKLSPHRRRCISIFPQKNSLCMIYKRFKLWGHWKCPHKSPSPCNTYVIPMYYTNLCPHKPHKHAHTHTHTHTHTLTSGQLSL